MDRIKKVTGTNDTYDDSYDDDYYQGFDNGYDEGGVDDDVQVAGGMGMGNTQQIGAQPMGGMNGAGMGTQPMPGGGSIGLSGSNIKMQVVRPKTYDSDTASQIANHLLNKSTVLLNLENTNKETSRRLIDFLSGVAYSIGGSLRKVALSAYIIAPSNVDVDEAKIKPTPRRSESQPEQKEASGEDFSDFN
ncbi:MAG: cell division protein SepF [Eubacteriales bacterium]